MLPDKYRLKRMKDFEILYREGRFVAGDLVQIKIWKIDTKKYPSRGYFDTDLKIGFVVGLKVSKNAVERNRAKRQMREVVRLLLKNDQIKSGFHMALMAKPEILGQKYCDIEKGIIIGLKRAGVYIDRRI